jgi:homotetrameric cytidine deaminase
MAAGLENREWIGVSRFLSVRFFQFLLEVVIVGLYFVMSLRIQLPTSARPQIIQPPMTWLVAVLSLVFVAYLVWDVLDVLQARTNNNSAWQRMAWVGGEVTLVFVALYALCFLLIRITEPTPYAAIWWSVPLAISLYVYRVAQEKAKDKLMMIDLRERAQQAAERAYAPYSKIHVGAAVRLKNGDIFTGVNVENASYGLTICAERAAVFSAVASAGPDISVTALALASTDPRVVSPCGACRQVLHEFGPSAVVILPNGDETTVSALLPGAFDL